MKIIVDGLMFSNKYAISKELGDDISFEVIDTDLFFKAIGFYLISNGITWYKYNRSIPKILSKLNLQYEWSDNNNLDIFINHNNITKTLDLTIIEETAFYFAAFEDIVEYLQEYLRKYFYSNSKNQIFVGSKSTYLVNKADINFFIIANQNLRKKILEEKYIERKDSYLEENLVQNINTSDEILLDCEYYPVKKTIKHKTIFINENQSSQETIEEMKKIIFTYYQDTNK